MFCHISASCILTGCTITVARESVSSTRSGCLNVFLTFLLSSWRDIAAGFAKTASGPTASLGISQQPVSAMLAKNAATNRLSQSSGAVNSNNNSFSQMDRRPVIASNIGSRQSAHAHTPFPKGVNSGRDLSNGNMLRGNTTNAQSASQTNGQPNIQNRINLAGKDLSKLPQWQREILEKKFRVRSLKSHGICTCSLLNDLAHLWET